MSTKNYVHRTTCRLCGAPEVVKVVDLEPIPLAEFYGASPEEGQARERFRQGHAILVPAAQLIVLTQHL